MLNASKFEALFNDLHHKIYAYVRAQVSNQHIAEDITAGVFERALKSRHTFDPKKGAADSWLFMIARNLVIDYFNARKRQPLLTQLDEADALSTGQPSPEQTILRNERRQQLAALVADLPERDREIIHLRFFGRLTNRKIAEILEINEKTVSVIIYRTLKKMKTRLPVEESL